MTRLNRWRRLVMAALLPPVGRLTQASATTNAPGAVRPATGSARPETKGGLGARGPASTTLRVRHVVVIAAALLGNSMAHLSASESWNTVVADMTVRRGRVSADGTTIRVVAPAVRYHWERSQTASGWRTTITIAFETRPMVRSLSGHVPLQARFAVARIVDDGDGTPLRLYNWRGEVLRRPSEADRRRLSVPAGSRRFQLPPLPSPIDPDVWRRPSSPAGREWIEALIASPAQSGARREGLRRHFGNAVNRVGGLDRFIKVGSNETREVLVDPLYAVPKEINLVRNGQLVTHSTFTYTPGSGGALVRRITRTEHLVPDGSGERAVTEVELANIRLEERR